MALELERDIDLLRRNTVAYAAMAAWAGAGIFDALADGALHVYSTLPGDERAIRRSSAIMVHLGLLVVDGDRVALTVAGKKLVASGVFVGLSADRVLGDLSRLDAVVAHGGPAVGADGSSRVTDGGVRDSDPEGAKTFMDMLYRRSGQSVDEVARWLAPRLPEAASILDLGGGHGRYGEALTERGFSVTLFDKPICVDIAKQRYGDRLQYRSGDFFEGNFGGPYDCAFLSNIVHGEGPEALARLLAKLHDSLGAGGMLAIKDMFIDEHGANPAEAVFFDVTMLMYTQHGQSYSVSHMRDLCGAAGFSDFEHVYVPDDRLSLIMCRRG